MEHGGGDVAVLGGLVVYLAIVLAVGFATFRRMRSLDDFVLGGRRLGPWVTAISERASGESAWFLLGLPGAAYALGFREFWSVIGIAAGIFASWTLLAWRLRRDTERLNALTLPDYFEERFDDRSGVLRVVAMLIIVFFYTLYVGAQFVGAGKILDATFGLPQTWGMVLGAAVVVFYTLMGGFLAVAWTDLVQGVLMALVALVLPLLAIQHMGGAAAFVDTLAARGPGFLEISGGEVGGALWFGVVLGGATWGLGYLGQPHLLTRYMAIRRARDLRKSTVIAMVWVLCAYWGAAFIGLAGHGVLGSELADQEQVMPLLAKALLPGWIAGLVIAGAIAAMMSTADSQLLVATSSVIEDLYARFLKRDANPALLVTASRVCTVAIAGVALGLAFANQDLIFSLVEYAWTGLGSSFGPALLLALWWRGTTRWGVLAGMLAGTGSTILWKNVGALENLVDIKLASFVIGFLAVWCVSLVTPDSRRQMRIAAG